MGPKRRPWDDRTREKIQTGKLINLLHKCAEGTQELTFQRLRAIEILLRKVLPDLVATAVTADVTHRYVVELPPVLSREDWEKVYGAGQQRQIGPPEGPPPDHDPVEPPPDTLQ